MLRFQTVAMWFRDTYGEKSFADVQAFLADMEIKLVRCGQCFKTFDPDFHKDYRIHPDKQKDSDDLITCPFCWKEDEEAMWFPDLFY